MDEQIVVFQLGVFGWLVTLGAAVTVVTAPKLARVLHRPTVIRGGSIPIARLALVVGVQNLIFVAITAAMGAAVAHRVGLHAPLFEALASGGPVAPAVIPQLMPAIVFGGAGALVFLIAYYKVFRPRLDESVIASEHLRFEIGIVTRMMQGGIIEEIMFRWGVMSALGWVGAGIVGGPTQLVMWAAIVVAGVLFGLAHLPSTRLAGVKMSTVVILTAVVLNLWGGIVFGWLFWRYGLLSAMIAHALFHLVWFPFEKHVVRLEEAKTTDPGPPRSS